MTHPVNPPSPQRPAARTEQADSAAMLPEASRKTVVSAVDGSSAVPALSLTEQQGASANQGRNKVYNRVKGHPCDESTPVICLLNSRMHSLVLYLLCVWT